ncbi:MAG: glutathione S-transferase N-terminal domain-containing protein [Geminicoccaceae bacterium]
MVSSAKACKHSRDAPDVARALRSSPFSSYTQKVLIALYENGTPFDFPLHRAGHARACGGVAAALARLRKFPLLVDGERQVVETSIIIEYLGLVHPGPARLLPAAPLAALDVRFLDLLRPPRRRTRCSSPWTVR